MTFFRQNMSKFTEKSVWMTFGHSFLLKSERGHLLKKGHLLE